MSRFLKFPALGALVLWTATATGAPIAYDEASGGDIDGKTFALGAGLNTIKGTVRLGEFSPTAPHPEDQDDFFISIGAGNQLTRISGTFSLRNEGGATFTEILWHLGNANQFVDLPSSLDMWTALTPLGAGTYGIDSLGFYGAYRPNQYRIADYAFDLVVEGPDGVPEPATVALVGAALSALAVQRRRSRSSGRGASLPTVA